MLKITGTSVAADAVAGTVIGKISIPHRPPADLVRFRVAPMDYLTISAAGELLVAWTAPPPAGSYRVTVAARGPGWTEIGHFKIMVTAPPVPAVRRVPREVPADPPADSAP